MAVSAPGHRHDEDVDGVVIAALACAVALVGPALAAAHQPRARRSIVGGQPASAGTFPWLALIIDDLPNGTAELCTGTVLSPRSC